MKKAFVVVIVMFCIALGVGACYLIYKTWSVFGFWNLVVTGSIDFVSFFFFGQLIGSRKQAGAEIVYEPKEWPKFLTILVSIGIGYYLFTIINRPSVSKGDYIFGMCYLSLLALGPVLVSLYRLIRDRNDFIRISPRAVSFRNNSETGEFPVANIQGVELEGGIKLVFKNGESFTIKTDEMNFNARDLMGAIADINKLLPQQQ